MNRKHAVHNEKACTHLLNAKLYNDWVVTTAFYSAMYYVYSAIFPIKYNKIDFPNFENYYLYCKKNQKNFPNKHKFTKDLVYEKLNPECSDKYNKLFDLCHSARYVNYSVSKNIANHAVKLLDSIKKSTCSK